MLIRQIVASAVLMLTLGFVLAHAPVIFTIGMVLWIALSVALAPLFGRWLRSLSESFFTHEKSAGL